MTARWLWRPFRPNSRKWTPKGHTLRPSKYDESWDTGFLVDSSAVNCKVYIWPGKQLQVGSEMQLATAESPTHVRFCRSGEHTMWDCRESTDWGLDSEATLGVIHCGPPATTKTWKWAKLPRGKWRTRANPKKVWEGQQANRKTINYSRSGQHLPWR